MWGSANSGIVLSSTAVKGLGGRFFRLRLFRKALGLLAFESDLELKRARRRYEREARARREFSALRPGGPISRAEWRVSRAQPAQPIRVPACESGTSAELLRRSRPVLLDLDGEPRVEFARKLWGVQQPRRRSACRKVCSWSRAVCCFSASVSGSVEAGSGGGTTAGAACFGSKRASRFGKDCVEGTAVPLAGSRKRSLRFRRPR